jgi:hypothetical protein
MGKMSKLIALAAAAALVVLAPSVVSAKKPTKASGVIETLNESSKELVVKDSAGQQHIIDWNDKTKLTGTPKVGETVTVLYKKDSDGKAWAKEITVGPVAEPAEAAEPAEPAKK